MSDTQFDFKALQEHQDKKLLEYYEGDVARLYQNKLWDKLNRRLDIFPMDEPMDTDTLLRKVDVLERDLEEIFDDWVEEFAHAVAKLDDET